MNSCKENYAKLVMHLQKYHTGCPNMVWTGQIQYFEAQKFASEDYEFYKKNCILLHKIAFLAFFVNCKNENGIFRQLFSNYHM